MPEKSPENILEKLPKKTPTWAIGIVTIIVALSTSVITLYVLSRDEVRQVITWKQTQQEKSDSQAYGSYSLTLTKVLSLVDTNSAQIVELSKALVLTQQQNVLLTTRVDDLENKASRIAEDLKACEQLRDNCLERNFTNGGSK